MPETRKEVPRTLKRLAASLPAPPAAPETWESIIPLGDYDLPAFPVDRLPRTLAAMVRSAAEATQTPPDMAAMLAISALSVCCGGRLKVRVREGYEEPLNTFVAVAMPPGNRKTAVVRAMVASIEEFEREEQERLKDQVARARAEREAVEERIAHLKKQAARQADDDERRATLETVGELAAHLASTPAPSLPRLLADDVTSEAVPRLMATCGGRIGIVSAEGGLFETIAGRYANGVPNLDVFLKGHAGDSLRVDRRQGEPVHIDDPALTLGMAVQPDVLRGMASKPGFYGRGLIARFLYSAPPSMVGSRRTLTEPVPAHVKRAYDECVRTLLRAATDQERPRILALSTEARALWESFSEAIEPRMGADGNLGAIAEWASKLAGAVARIAALLHAASCAEAGRPVDGPVGAEAMASAVAIGEYLIPHALAVHDQMGADPVMEDARRLVAWLRRKRVESFPARDAWQQMKSSRITRMEHVDAILRVAERHHYIRRAPERAATGGGRPQGQTYETNPALFEVAARPPVPQIPRNQAYGEAVAVSGGYGGLGDKEKNRTSPNGAGGGANGGPARGAEDDDDWETIFPGAQP